MSQVTDETPRVVQQSFVDDVRARSLFAPLPIIAGGEDAPAAATPPAPPAGGGNDPSADAGQGANGDPSKGGGGFNWGLFPDVPEEQRALLEPHLKNVQSHVGKLEQQYAPYKDLPQGVTPESIGGLIRFDQQFSQDPMGTWLSMGLKMQESGAISEELDLEAVGRILRGEPDPVEGGDPAGGGNEGADIDPQLQAALNEVAQLKQRLDGRDQQDRTAQQEQLLNQTMGTMRESLKGAGIPEDVITDELLNGQLVAHRGDVDKAVQAIVSFREANLKGFTENAKKNTADKDLELPNGLPKEEVPRRGKDAWSSARASAEHRLAKSGVGTGSN